MITQSIQANLSRRQPSNFVNTEQSQAMGQASTQQSFLQANMIVLPKRKFSKKDIISTISNGAVIAGTGLGLFNPYGVQIAGTVCKTMGFGLNQVCDGLKNRQTRNENTRFRNEFIEKQRQKSSNISLQPLTLKDKYGLNLTNSDIAINIVITTINTLLQLLASGFLIGRTINTAVNKNRNKTDVDWGMAMPALGLSMIAFILDKLEQHIKQDNLNRYQAQLNQGIAVLNNLPDSDRQEPTTSNNGGQLFITHGLS